MGFISEDVAMSSVQVVTSCTAQSRPGLVKRRQLVADIPLEVLWRIFEFAVYSSHLYGSSYTRRRVATVCRRWREAAVSDPFLWNRQRISFFQHGYDLATLDLDEYDYMCSSAIHKLRVLYSPRLSFIDLVLKRSTAAPLHLAFHVRCSAQPTQHWMELVHLLYRVFPRCESIEYDGLDPRFCYWGLLEIMTANYRRDLKPYPRLRSFVFRDAAHVNYDLSEAPHLRTAYVRGCPLLSPSALSTLSHLGVEGGRISDGTLAPATPVLSQVDGSTSLRVLVFNEGDGSVLDRRGTIPTLHLPNLACLSYVSPRMSLLSTGGRNDRSKPPSRLDDGLRRVEAPHLWLLKLSSWSSAPSPHQFHGLQCLDLEHNYDFSIKHLEFLQNTPYLVKLVLPDQCSQDLRPRDPVFRLLVQLTRRASVSNSPSQVLLPLLRVLVLAYDERMHKELSHAIHERNSGVYATQPWFVVYHYDILWDPRPPRDKKKKKMSAGTGKLDVSRFHLDHPQTFLPYKHAAQYDPFDCRDWS